MRDTRHPVRTCALWIVTMVPLGRLTTTAYEWATGERRTNKIEKQFRNAAG